MPDIKEVVREPPKLLEQNLTLEEAFFSRALAIVTLPAGWTFEDCLKPEFWVNVQRYFAADPATGRADRAGAHIEVRTEDHAFIATFYVRAVVPGGLVVECVGPDVDPKTGIACLPHYFGRPSGNAVAGYEFRWNVGKRGFDILRLSDNTIVGNEKTRELAAEWVTKMTGQKAAA